MLLGAALSVVHAALSRGLRTGLGVLLLVAVVAVVFEAVGLATGFPYGSYSYSDTLGPTLLGVPFLVPLAWLMMAWPSWVLAERLARRCGRRAPRRSGSRGRGRLRRLGRRPRPADGPGRLLDVGAPGARAARASTRCR